MKIKKSISHSQDGVITLIEFIMDVTIGQFPHENYVPWGVDKLCLKVEEEHYGLNVLTSPHLFTSTIHIKQYNLKNIWKLIMSIFTKSIEQRILKHSYLNLHGFYFDGNFDYDYQDGFIIRNKHGVCYKILLNKKCEVFHQRSFS